MSIQYKINASGITIKGRLIIGIFDRGYSPHTTLTHQTLYQYPIFDLLDNNEGKGKECCTANFNKDPSVSVIVKFDHQKLII